LRSAPNFFTVSPFSLVVFVFVCSRSYDLMALYKAIYFYYYLYHCLLLSFTEEKHESVFKKRDDTCSVYAYSANELALMKCKVRPPHGQPTNPPYYLLYDEIIK